MTSLDQSVSDSTTLTVTRMLDAPREAVFAAWTDPKQFAQWMGPGSIRAEIDALDARVGGTYRIVMRGTPNPAGMSIVSGVYREIVPPSRLVLTWAWEEDMLTHKAGHESLVTLTLRPVGGKTELTLTHERLESKGSRDSHAQGWEGCFEKLVKYLEQGRV
ncbi:MAG TPA: SRPBCC domain-containing protein [Stellaceae bacterium]|nr:SRPBCC domain-containing protein [Stellaceae bacterium]